MIGFKTRPEVKYNDVQYQLMWLLRVLWKDNLELNQLGLVNVMDELDRLTQAESEARSLISDLVGDLLFDSAVIGEALRQLHHYQPWSSRFEHKLADQGSDKTDEHSSRLKDIEKDHAKHTESWQFLLKATIGSGEKRIVQLGKVGDKKFFYPINKRRTKENVDVLRTADRNLDAFWAAVDHNLKERAGDSYGTTALCRLLSQTRYL